MKPPLRWTFAYTTVEPGKIIDHTLRIRVSGWWPFAFVRHTKVQRPEPAREAEVPVGAPRDPEFAWLADVDPWWRREEQALHELAAQPLSPDGEREGAR